MKGYKAGKRTGKKGPNGPGMWYCGKGLDEWASGKRDDGGKKGGKHGSRGSKSDGYGVTCKGSNGNNGKGRGTSETFFCYDCGEQRHIGVNCPYKWTNNIDEEDDQGSSWESEFEVGEKPEELASLEAPDNEGKLCWPKRKKSRRLED